MDPIKEAFFKIKEEIFQLKEDISILKSQLKEISINTPQYTDNPTHIQTNPTHNSLNTPQYTDNPTHIQTNPTHNYAIESSYSKNIDSSIGNKGVPTNKPTNQQTYRHIDRDGQFSHKTDFKQASEILSSLDTIKKGIRLKFKRLTPQEMQVFSVLYSLEEQKTEEITYRDLSQKLCLSESSIRDYINKLIKKGVPIEKIRQNNKTILLQISQDLKNIATLATIQNLREL